MTPSVKPSDRPVALVTGATSGIGLALARLCARRGYDVALVARNAAALETLAAELKGAGAKVHVLAKDLSRVEGAHEVVAELTRRGVGVDLLVNNAGFGVHGPFEESDGAAELALVDLQIGATLQLTKDVLPGMIARGRGRILNVGSVYSFSPVPFQAVYGACKSFLWSFSQALDNEVRDRGVTVTVLCPGVTRTEFRKRSGKPDKNKGMSAEAVAEAGLDGTLAGRRLVVPGTLNRLFVMAVRHVPLFVIPPLMRAINTFRGLVKKPPKPLRGEKA